MSTPPIIPENLILKVDGYAPERWDYPRRCADVDGALVRVREEIEEWTEDADPHGWWHRRPYLIALYNEVVRLRADSPR